MANKMLIDASHREETRVVVLRGNRIEEFDFESESRKQLRGNIYLARVTRVEPSLQAAFVEYGGNRHGFLAFSEIHPDYYQIPVADRQALLAQDAAVAREEDEEDNGKSKENGKDRRRKRGRGRRRGGKQGEGDAIGAAPDDAEAQAGQADAADADATPSDEISADAAADEPETTDEPGGDDSDKTPRGGTMAARVHADSISEPAPEANGEDSEGNGDNGDNGDDEEDGAQEEHIESVGAEDALEELPDRRRMPRRQYKIQEVIKRRQILLVQVVKEERGNKGAALTTYLSLAGRYSVLMPNTARGGGISRKITQMQDRKRLKEIVHELEVPDGMGVILRTAGANRTKAEIKRDYEYLMRLWENVRNLTLQSTAPCLVYEEGSLIKRAIRDLYNKDIDEIQVAGDDGYREAKDFMRMLMPSHAKAVQPYKDATPLFARAGIEQQLDKMLQPQVTLRSGGYIIINQTEALVSIDVNSGRSTREHSIEDTALQTNLEAAEEVARQLRLRDLAGLIVIDFIDMDEKRNNRAVEKRIKDCLKNDRARIQVGRISHFGLLEMSRQRIRASVLESAMKPCPHCGGIGLVRSDSSEALHVIRSIEEALLKNSGFDIKVRTSTHTALYILNHKRTNILELEHRFGLKIVLEADETLGHQHFAIERGDPARGPATTLPEASKPAEVEEPIIVEEDQEGEPSERDVAAGAREAEGDGDGSRRRKRRRRRRRGRDREDQSGGESIRGSRQFADAYYGDDEEPESGSTGAESYGDSADIGAEDAADGSQDDRKPKRRRGKRGGRRFKGDEGTAVDAADTEEVAGATEKAVEKAEVSDPEDAPSVRKQPRKRQAKRGKAENVDAAPQYEEPVAEAAAEPVEEKTRRRAASAPIASAPVLITEGSDASPESEESDPTKPKRSGWWLKRGFL
jgi:ribonuclease E